MKKTIEIYFEEIETFEQLTSMEQKVLNKAIEIAHKSYSPYSDFPVGAAVLLDNGEVFAGNNQENIAFPSGTCAERTVLNYVHANFPEQSIELMAIVTLKNSQENPASPCGFCRQVMVEMERIQEKPYRVLLHKLNAQTFAFDSASSLLPLAFDEELRK